MKRMVVFTIWMVLFVGFLLVFARLGYKNIIYDKMGYRNIFIEFVLSNGEIDPDDNREVTQINWAEIYPKNENDDLTEQSSVTPVTMLVGKVKKLKEKIEWYYEDGFPLYVHAVEIATTFDTLLGWDIQPTGEALILENGYCVDPEAQLDITESVQNLEEFNHFLKNDGRELLYVQAPFKIYSETVLPLGYIDYSNQNADAFIKELERKNIDYLDLREVFMTDESKWYELFYITDNHWKVQTAFDATDIICNYLSELYGCNYSKALFDLSEYQIKRYNNIYLGAYGRKFTLAKVKPEDFEFIIPKYETSFHFYMPELGIDAEGDFEELFIDYDKLEVANHYTSDAYMSYRTRGYYLTQIYNKEADNKGKRVLILRDSYANPVVPFLALEYEYVDSIQPKEFDGSIASYIDETDPDIVIVMYTTSNLENEDDGSFDFE